MFAASIVLVFLLKKYINTIFAIVSTMERDSEFSKTAGHRLIQNQTNQRVSEDAAVELIEYLENKGQEVAEQAQKYADHAGRKTIQHKDVRQAVRDFQ